MAIVAPQQQRQPSWVKFGIIKLADRKRKMTKTKGIHKCRISAVLSPPLPDMVYTVLQSSVNLRLDGQKY